MVDYRMCCLSLSVLPFFIFVCRVSGILSFDNSINHEKSRVLTSAEENRFAIENPNTKGLIGKEIVARSADIIEIRSVTVSRKLFTFLCFSA